MKMDGLSFDCGDNVNVHLFFVDMSQIDSSLNELKKKNCRGTHLFIFVD